MASDLEGIDYAEDMWDLVFVRFVVGQEDTGDDEDLLAVYCVSLGSLGRVSRCFMVAVVCPKYLPRFLFSLL